MSRKRKSDWSRILSEYGKRDCSREEFCEKHKINVASLKYHLNQKEPISSFTPVKVVEEKKKSSAIILELPPIIYARSLGQTLRKNIRKGSVGGVFLGFLSGMISHVDNLELFV